MGISSRLKHVDADLFELMLEHPELISLLLNAQWMDNMDYKSYFEATKDLVTLEQLDTLKQENPRVFQRIVVDIEVMTGFPELNLHKYWNEIHYLLNGESIDQSRPTYLLEEEPKNGYSPRVNALFGGREFDGKTGYLAVYYLFPNEVRQISEGLCRIPEADFRERVARALEISESGLQSDDDEPELSDWLSNYFEALHEYYLEASLRRNVMLAYYG